MAVVPSQKPSLLPHSRVGDIHSSISEVFFYANGMQTAGAEKTIDSQGTKGQMLPPSLS